jgi:hypothetical protein
VERSGHLRAAEECGTGMGTIGVSIIALREVPVPAVGAVTTGNGGGDHYPVPDAEVAYVRPELFDNADTLVPQIVPGFIMAIVPRTM